MVACTACAGVMKRCVECRSRKKSCVKFSDKIDFEDLFCFWCH